MTINRKRKFFSTLFYKIITIIFAIMMFTIVVMNLFIDHRANYACKNNVAIPNIVLVVIGVATVAIVCAIYYKFIRKYIDKLSKLECNVILGVGCFTILLLQLYFAYNIYFLSGWDVGIMRESSAALGNNQLFNSDFGYYSYFKRYPNNIFLTFVFTLICKITIMIGIDNFEFVLVAFSVLSVNISIWFVAKSAMILFRNRHYTIFVVAVYVIYIAFSPWIVIPYSDTYVTMFTIGALYFYLNKNNMNIYVSWFLVFIFSLVGYLIKPTCIIVLIAIMLNETWKFIFIERKAKLKRLKMVPSLLVAIVLFMGLNIFSANYLGYEKDEDIEFPMTHFLMMGMNKETKGVYNQEDVNLTTSNYGKQKKIDANLTVIKSRLMEYGAIGYLNLLGDKLLTNYNDGTFAWSVEGNFYSIILEPKNSKLSPILREICYNTGKYYDYYATYQQCMWITILVLVFFSLKKCIVGDNDNLYVLALSIIGITLFLLLFEARARYLYLYSSYYILLAGIGLQGIIEMINKRCGIQSK